MKLLLKIMRGTLFLEMNVYFYFTMCGEELVSTPGSSLFRVVSSSLPRTTFITKPVGKRGGNSQLSCLVQL